MSGKAFFYQRLNDHVQYLNKIQSTLGGKGDFQGTDFHDCKLGCWIYGDGADEVAAVSDEAKQLFDSLIEPHQKFHEASKLAVEKHQSGDSTGAEVHVTEMHKLSATLVNTLIELDKTGQ